MAAGLESGADDYLTKPFDPEELKARLRTGIRILDLENRLIEAREEMRFQATHDALTSVWNRGVIMELLGRELTLAPRRQMYGHLAGDEVQMETARRLVSSLRSYDFVGRFGGEEFLVTLNNCDPAYALVRAERIRETFCKHPVKTSAGSVPISMSFGLLLSQEWGYLSVAELLHEADIALHSAKAGGRNCVKPAIPKTQAKCCAQDTPGTHAAGAMTCLRIIEPRLGLCPSRLNHFCLRF
ncbi:MAG: hypothetical protein DMG38_25295 [Acidobacteria bacterium]|nr:MAG: hypothetical protein DMG38_25295 [Acidobacteriota bacterium]